MTTELYRMPREFEGSKEDCEKWIKEHTKKTWLEEYLDNKYLPDMGVRNPVNEGIRTVCKEILEKVPFENIKLSDRSRINLVALEKIIKDLGVEV